MFIETHWVVIAIIVIVYLLWSKSWTKNRIALLSEKLNEYSSNKELTIKELCNLLALEDARFLAKVSDRTANKILAEQAHDLLLIFRNHHTSDCVLSDGTIPVEDSPEVRLSHVMEDGEISFLDDDKEIEQEIVLALKDKMAKYK